ncbi:lipid II:glycine glycyltransferase FemX [Serpentinicella alkaliphila]|uniref:Lipid II:glycine glycyltransferase (Peptidoglycan interpeptide bridge formation enzyme) n=1 Tax=Serpentinicella alkaliphila TaxID=1734049 RepID=A0A4R2TEM2_9FIRM|nr:peptidoglycan bridge formation glycyltransferase FemA/FemB family protein [Serpentinicella alkaliphila]QUH25903.1 peptidoglycan bridge formation glycyltransferase FemA/FemB family protein [Serpentinicella alkaliphila]TCQ01970.1 lipid II:glycine glycyltransferase (peptidoglycan interpeptide bridge formation enzyme) [Serpentinicella alkaliphila]
MPILDKTNKADIERYNNFVRNSKFSNVTQDISWSSVKKDWENEQIYIEKDGEIVGAMSLLIRKGLGGFSMLYAPKGPVCDINDLETVQNLISEVDIIAKKYNAFMLRFDPEAIYDKDLENKYFKLGYKVRNIGFDQNSLIQPRYNMILYMDKYTEDELLESFNSKTRYNIRLASRKGVKVNYYDSEEALKIFYELYEITAGRNKIGMRPYSYFENMLNAFGERLRIYITEHEGDYLSAAISINYADKVWYIYGASSNVKRNLMPNYIMQWEMIKWAKEVGANKYDFGGVFELNNEDGLFRFKEGFCNKDGVTEFIGEIDKVYKPSIYYAFTTLVPKVQEFRKKINKRG